jgi:hypothetical protein
MSMAAFRPAQVAVLPGLRGSNQIGKFMVGSMILSSGPTSVFVRVSTRRGNSAIRETDCKGCSPNGPQKRRTTYFPPIAHGPSPIEKGYYIVTLADGSEGSLCIVVSVAKYRLWCVSVESG